MSTPFRQDRSPVEKPDLRLTDLPPMARVWMPELRQRRSGWSMGGKRQGGWHFSLVSFLFGHAKRK